jgi:hypothetical protein
MAHGAYFHVHVVIEGGTGREAVATAAIDRDFLVSRMDAFFHVIDLTGFPPDVARTDLERAGILSGIKGLGKLRV